MMAENRRSLRQVAVRAAAFGAGFAVAGWLIYGIIHVVKSRSKPWDSRRVVAQFLELDGGYIEPLTFRYVLTNKSGKDLHLLRSNTIVMVKHDASLRSADSVATIPEDTFLPANQPIEFAVQILYYYLGQLTVERTQFLKQLRADGEFMSLTQHQKAMALAQMDPEFAALSSADRSIVIERGFPENTPSPRLSREERAKVKKQHVRELFPRLLGFTLFHSSEHVQIDLPKGW